VVFSTLTQQQLSLNYSGTAVKTLFMLKIYKAFIKYTMRAKCLHHLEQHLLQISPQDHKSRAILEQMKVDELHHATIAEGAGSADLPTAVRLAMRLTSRVMTIGAYYI